MAQRLLFSLLLALPSVAEASTSTTAMSSTAAGSTITAAMMSSTAAGSTATTAMMSSTAAATTVAMTTTATVPTNPPALTPNTTVEVLPTPISNEGCSSSLLCAAEPESCDPSMAGCFFLGTKQAAGQNFEFSLSGESEGYIGCTLSTDSTLGGNDTTYICANNNGSLEFIGTMLNNGLLIRQPVNANSVKGRIDGTIIQCTFAATVPDATDRAPMSFALFVVKGTFSPSTGDLGPPEAKVQTNVLNIADPNSITSSILTTVATSTDANSGRPTHQALSQALLIIIGNMGLALL